MRRSGLSARCPCAAMQVAFAAYIMVFLRCKSGTSISRQFFDGVTEPARSRRPSTFLHKPSRLHPPTGFLLFVAPTQAKSATR
jgi:hypothetical protein